MDCESATYLHCTAEFAQLTRLVAADVRSTHSCAVNPTGDAQELALDWAMEAPYHVDVTGWVREVC
jgi:hypothetical protein